MIWTRPSSYLSRQREHGAATRLLDRQAFPPQSRQRRRRMSGVIMTLPVTIVPVARVSLEATLLIVQTLESQAKPSLTSAVQRLTTVMRR